MKLYNELLQAPEPQDPVDAIQALIQQGLLDHQVEPGQAVTWGELALLVVKLKK